MGDVIDLSYRHISAERQELEELFADRAQQLPAGSASRRRIEAALAASSVLGVKTNGREG